jgi:ribosomal protein L1
MADVADKKVSVCVWLPSALRELLRIAAFTERKTLSALAREGIEARVLQTFERKQEDAQS